MVPAFKAKGSQCKWQRIQGVLAHLFENNSNKLEAVDTEFQDCMAAMVRKFSGSEEARRATAGEMMQDCNRRDRAAEEKPDHDSYWDGFQVNQINQIF